MTDDETRDTLIVAMLPHVAFDGWSPTAFKSAVRESGIAPSEARRLFPRGAVDAAVALHERGDAAMRKALQNKDLTGLKIREKVAFALQARVEAIEDKEATRRASALFALPLHAPEGARLIWNTADAIWTALGDTSRDINWYSKRATLSAVWGSVLLYWLGDDSAEGQNTQDFIDRRIDDVMAVEKVKGQLRGSALLRPLTAPLSRLGDMVRPPQTAPKNDLPGQWVSEPRP